MKPLKINKSQATPLVLFDAELNKLSISGRSYPENARLFYDPILTWLSENIDSLESNFIFEINLEYYNTASSKYLLELLKKFETISLGEKISISIIWMYLENDEDMKDAGKEYKQIIKMPFEFVVIPE